MKFYENCGAKIEGDSLFCGECGTLQEVATSPVKKKKGDSSVLVTVIAVIVDNKREIVFENHDEDGVM